MRKRYSADQWRAWHMEFASSDLTVKQFCESVGTSVQSFYKWRRRLAEPKPCRDEFTPVIMVSEPAISFEFPGGVEVKLANDVAALRPLVSLLLEQGDQA